MDSLEHYLKEESGLEKIARVAWVKYAIQGLTAFSVVKSSKKIYILFPLFRDEHKGVRTTLRDNKQRDIFIQRVSGDDRVDLSTNVPTATFYDEEDAVDFFKRNGLVELAKEYAKFSEIQTDFTIGEETHDGKILRYRANIPTEVEIMRDVFRNREYERRGLIINKQDIVLDLGGNIGAFTCGIFDKAKKVVVFEPEDVNFEFLSSNIEINKADNVIAIKKAVVGNDDKVRDFFLGKVPYYYSFLIKNNRKRVPVKCININDVMKKYNPTKMKVDIEGSEFEVLTNCRDFRNVKQLIFEYNFDMNGDLKSGFKNFKLLSNHLEENGFDVSSLRKYSRSTSWCAVFLCNRVS